MDDLIALIVLNQLARSALTSIIISHGNSKIDIAEKTTHALLDFMGRSDVAVGVSDKLVQNPFPDAWQKLSDNFHTIVEKTIGERKLRSPISIQESFQRWQNELQATDSGIIVATGPLTNISALLTKLPHNLVEKMKLFWMGGTLDVAGNVTTSDGSHIKSEWNSYADPKAIDNILRMDLDFFIVPLDVTNHFQVNTAMIQMFRSAKSTLANIVSALLEFSIGKYDYYLWDPIASVLAINPHFAEWETVHMSAEQSGKNSGRLYRNPSGHKCNVAMRIQHDRIINTITESLRIQK